MRRFLIAALVASAFGAHAQNNAQIEGIAQSMVGTLHAGFQRSSRDGELDGCGMDFIVLGRDFSTKQGGFYKAVGSYYFRSMNGVPQFWLKLGITDLSSADLKSEKQATLANAFVASGSLPSIKPAAKVNSESPGFVIYVFEASEQAANLWAQFTTTGKLDVGFNRKPGESDVGFLFDGTVSKADFLGGEFLRQHSDELLDRVRSCTETLVGKIISKDGV